MGGALPLDDRTAIYLNGDKFPAIVHKLASRKANGGCTGRSSPATVALSKVARPPDLLTNSPGIGTDVAETHRNGGRGDLLINTRHYSDGAVQAERQIIREKQSRASLAHLHPSLRQETGPGLEDRAENMEFSDPYRGSPIVPHASEKFFTQYFLGVMVSRLIQSQSQRWGSSGADGAGLQLYEHIFVPR